MSRAIRACASGNVKKLISILQQNPELINFVNRDGYTPLSTAIAYNSKAVVDYLLSLSADIDVNAGANGMSPVFCAINDNNESLAIELLRKGVNPNTFGPLPQTRIIHYCIQQKLTRVIRQLFRMDTFEYQFENAMTKETILHVIVAQQEINHKNVFVVNLLQFVCESILKIEKLINRNQINNEKKKKNNSNNEAKEGIEGQIKTEKPRNESAIIKCQTNIRRRSLKELLNARDKNGCTPLWTSISYGNVQICQMLVTYGSTVNRICSGGQTVAHLIYADPNLLALFETFLTENGADIDNIRDDNGFTAKELPSMHYQSHDEAESDESDSNGTQSHSDSNSASNSDSESESESDSDSDSDNDEDEEWLMQEMKNRRLKLNHASIDANTKKKKKKKNNKKKTSDLNRISKRNKSESNSKQMVEARARAQRNTTPSQKHLKLNQWLNEYGLRESFAERLILNHISYNVLMHHSSEDQIFNILEEHFYEFADETLQYFIDSWKETKDTLFEKATQNAKEQKQTTQTKPTTKQSYLPPVVYNDDDKKIETKEEAKEAKEANADGNNIMNMNMNNNSNGAILRCNEFVLKFLSDFNILDFQFLMAREHMDMSHIAKINQEWIHRHLTMRCENDMRLKLNLQRAVKYLRQEIVNEVTRKYMEENKRNETLFKHKNRINGLRKLHPLLAYIYHTFFLDPLKLLLFGFALFVLFTLVVIVIVGLD